VHPVKLGLLTVLAWLGAAVLALLVYAPSLPGPFVSDDVFYLETNPLLELPFGAALAKLFTPHFTVGNWSPLHFLWLRACWEAFAAGPLGHRLASVLLHAGVALACALAARRAGLGRGAAALAGALLLVHPAAVEAVAWISQSKTLLAAALALLALERWLAHLERPSAGRATAALALALAAQLAKPAALALPGVFAVALLSHGGRRARDLGWLALLGLLTLPNLAMALWAQAAQGGVAEWFGGSPAATLRILPWVLWRYLRVVVWPSGLALGVHPEPVAAWLDARLLGPLLACAAVAAAAWRALRAEPRLALAVAWFVLALLPVLQAIPTQEVYADRYLYYALPGAVAPLAAGAAFLFGRARGVARGLLAVTVFAALFALAGASARQARLWSDPEALFARSAALFPLGRTGWTGLGAERHRRGDLEGAAGAYLRSLAVHPEDSQVRHLLGRVRLAQDRPGEALYHLEESLRLRPGHHDARWMRTTRNRLRGEGVAPSAEDPAS
jgi:tetratricopeptide (TPR) repeat protein